MSKNPKYIDTLIAKWSDPELGAISIANIKNRDIQENLAQLLENQEQKDFHGNILSESDTGQFISGLGNVGGQIDGSANSAAYQFKPVSLALVRRTFPALFANKCVGVQAMNTPVGLAYALRVFYKSSTQRNEAAWDLVPEYSGYTGSTSGTSGTADGGTGTAAATAENWQIGPNGAYPALQVVIDQKTITAITRKLAASFSLETSQDIRAMHNFDLERQIVEILQYEVIAELDRELLAAMKTAAVDTTNGGATVTSLNLSATNGSTYVDGRWSQEKIASVVSSIIYQAEKIAVKTRRGAGNFAVVSPAVATALQAARPVFTGVPTNVDSLGGVAEIGSLNGSIAIYRDQYALDGSEYALIGFKGAGISDAGIIYSPYITGVINRAVNPQDFSPNIGTMSRYAITTTLLGAGRYYRQINYTNLNYAIAGATT
jgi:hypothetical protein